MIEHQFRSPYLHFEIGQFVLELALVEKGVLTNTLGHSQRHFFVVFNLIANLVESRFDIFDFPVFLSISV